LEEDKVRTKFWERPLKHHLLGGKGKGVTMASLGDESVREAMPAYIKRMVGKKGQWYLCRSSWDAICNHSKLISNSFNIAPVFKDMLEAKDLVLRTPSKGSRRWGVLVS
jgi:hypothetical protein